MCACAECVGLGRDSSSQPREDMKACLPSGGLERLRPTPGPFLAQRICPPTIQIGWIFNNFEVSGRESVYTLGAGSVALRKRYFQMRAFQRAVPSQLS